METRLQLRSDAQQEAYRQKRVEAFAERCRAEGLAVTPQRRAIIEALLSSASHPRAEEVYEIVRELHPNISLATVHRTLETLCRIGEAQKVTPLHTSARYDGNVEPHQHLVCVECHRILDVEVPGLQEQLSDINKAKDFKLLGVSVEFHGICKDCRP
jgi:Fur family peroxide stress response transcriptional regulator